VDGDDGLAVAHADDEVAARLADLFGAEAPQQGPELPMIHLDEQPTPVDCDVATSLA
jgi:hypothetical protein